MRSDARRADNEAGPLSLSEVERLGLQIDKLTFATGALEPAPRAMIPLRPPRIDRILAPIDGTDASHDVLEWARTLAKGSGARVRVLHAIPTPGDSTMPGHVHANENASDTYRELEAQADAAVEAAAKELRDARVPSEATLASGPPASAITRVAAADRADLIVIGAREHDWKEKLLTGSITESVLRTVETNTLIAKTGLKRGAILAPVDGSPESKHAAALAVGLARALGTRAEILHVLGAPLRVPGAGEWELRGKVGQFNAGWPGNDVTFRLEHGNATEEILAAAERDVALVVMGSKGRTGLKSTILGSTSSAVYRAAKCPVLIVYP